MRNFFSLYFRYVLASTYIILGLLAWIMFFIMPLAKNSVLDILMVIIGYLGTPYGIYKLVDTIIDHKSLK